MSTITADDGTEIFYEDRASGRPIMFHHGWPSSPDDWGVQLMFFLQHGCRVVAHDRRGHGRSTQTPGEHDTDRDAADANPDGLSRGRSTPSVRVSPPDAPSSSATSPRVRAADSTDPERRSPRAFSETDFTDDLRMIRVPTLVMHGGDDQVVTIADSAPLSIEVLRHGALAVPPGSSPGTATVNADVINQDLLRFSRSREPAPHLGPGQAKCVRPIHFHQTPSRRTSTCPRPPSRPTGFPRSSAPI